MLITEAVAAYLRDKKLKSSADYNEMKNGLEQFLYFLSDSSPIKVKELSELSMVHFQEFLSYWAIRNCHLNPSTARYLLLALEDFGKYAYKRLEFDLPAIYRPVLEALKDDLPRVISLQKVLSPLRNDESLPYMLAVYGTEKSRELGIIPGDDYGNTIEGYMELKHLGEGTSAELFSLEKEMDIGPVKLSFEAAKLIREGDILYLKLGEKKDSIWEIIDAGFAYPSLAKLFAK